MRITKDKASNLYLGITVISTNILLSYYYIISTNFQKEKHILTRSQIYQLINTTHTWTWYHVTWSHSHYNSFLWGDGCELPRRERPTTGLNQEHFVALWPSILAPLNEACYINHSKVDWIYWTKLKDLITERSNNKFEHSKSWLEPIDKVVTQVHLPEPRIWPEGYRLPTEIIVSNKVWLIRCELKRWTFKYIPNSTTITYYIQGGCWRVMISVSTRILWGHLITNVQYLTLNEFYVYCFFGKLIYYVIFICYTLKINKRYHFAHKNDK